MTRENHPNVEKCTKCGIEIYTYNSYPICNSCFEKETQKLKKEIL